MKYAKFHTRIAAESIKVSKGLRRQSFDDDEEEEDEDGRARAVLVVVEGEAVGVDVEGLDLVERSAAPALGGVEDVEGLQGVDAPEQDGHDHRGDRGRPGDAVGDCWIYAVLTPQEWRDLDALQRTLEELVGQRLNAPRGEVVLVVGPASVVVVLNASSRTASESKTPTVRSTGSPKVRPPSVERAKKIVIRKGRENYLCLLNLEDAMQGAFAGRAATLIGRDQFPSRCRRMSSSAESFPSCASSAIWTRLFRSSLVRMLLMCLLIAFSVTNSALAIAAFDRAKLVGEFCKQSRFGWQSHGSSPYVRNQIEVTVEISSLLSQS